MEMRQIRGLEIARQKQVKPTENGWFVKSQSGAGSYRVDELFNCNCPDSQKRQATCKHAFAVRYFLQVEKETATGVQVEKVRITYKQAWKAYDAAQTQEIKLFDELLKDLVQGIDEPAQAFGRPRLSLRETAFCSIQKVYSQLSCRRAVSLFGNAVERQQITHKPHFSATSRLLNRPEITPILHELIRVTAAPLIGVETDFAVDSSGFRTTCFGAYAEQKYALNRDHKFIKAHAIVGVKTNIITGVEVLEGNSADCPQLPVLVEKTANGGFTVKELSADKAYNSADNYNAVAAIGGQAYIPFKENATGQSHGLKYRLWRKAFHYFQLNSQEFYEHYHKRSNIETTFGAVKKKFGDTLKSKNPKAQENELLCKLIAYNITVLIHEMHELGIKPDFSSQSPAGVANVA
ncbi:transposase [Candidatus Micrarchaeota archaeon]|nr:transposase [Candidatus Micrarchaeota archaeon]